MTLSIYLILAVLFIIFVIITYIYWVYDKKITIKHYISAISTVGITLIIIGFIYNYTKQVSNGVSTKEQNNIELINGTLVSLEKLFMDNYPYLEKLYQQMNRLPKDIPSNIDKSVENNDTIHASQIILQSFENNVTALGGSKADWESSTRKPWLVEFRRWFSSPELRKMWNLSQRLYGRDTIDFYNRYILSDQTSKPLSGTSI
jgi:predicted PurR-regulated permease PerM